MGRVPEKVLEEIRNRPNVLRELKEVIRREKTVTFLFAARDETHNNAAALKEFLETEG